MLHVPFTTFPADPFTGTRVPLGVPPIYSGWTVKKRLRLLDSIRPSADNGLASKYEEWWWHFSPGFWATAKGKRVLESVLYHSAFTKQNVLPERARAERTDSTFSWNGELLSRNFWTEWTHDGDIKGCGLYLQSVESTHCFISFPPMEITYKRLVCYASNKY
jgi:hypothetical protein